VTELPERYKRLEEALNRKPYDPKELRAALLALGPGVEEILRLVEDMPPPPPEPEDPEEVQRPK